MFGDMTVDWETCEDRGYRCCDAFPPEIPVSDMTVADYIAYYDMHLRQWKMAVSGSED